MIVFGICSLAAGAAPQADLELIRTRLIDSLLPRDPAGMQALSAGAARYSSEINAQFTWADADPSDKTANNWSMRKHFDRMLILAKASAAAKRSGRADAALTRMAVGALTFWVEHDFRNPNWWWNEIGTPQVIGEMLLLMPDDIPTELRARGIEIMKRSVWTKWTGQNLVWGVTIQILRGLIENNPTLVTGGYARMYDEINVTAKEGIQPDFSFHQHGDQFYSGGYGLSYAQDVGRYIAFAWGTSCAPSPEKMRLFSSYMLDGEAWMTWHDLMDYSALGREIVRKGKAAASRDWLKGPIVPTGASYSLGATVDLLAHLPVPRQSEFAAWADRLFDRDHAPALVGHKHFWNSDYTVHRRPTWMASVKMFSTRLQNTELVNGEGLKSHHLGDGNMFIYRTGDEYRDIFPVWDWEKVPGTTTEIGAEIPVAQRGKTSFVGGVSDGMYGASAIDLHRGNLTAHKSYFFFDDQIVCLGAGINCSSDNSVVTTINQCLLHGPVRKADDGSWVHHDGIGYVMEPGTAKLSTVAHRGSWKQIAATSSDEPVTMDIFELYLPHGPAHDASYAYTIYPDISAEETANRAAKPAVAILANRPDLQAVEHRDRQLLMAIFWQPGKIGTIEVDQPCMLMLDKKTQRMTLCNPENKPLSMKVRMNGKARTVDMPGDGSSATMTLDQE